MTTRTSIERVGASDLLPDLIDRLEATERLHMLLSERNDTPLELQVKALCDAIDLRVMLTHRMQQLEVFEAQGSHARAYLYWSTFSRMWVAETEGLQ